MTGRAILLVDCPDRRGLVAAISQFLYLHGANILDAEQHQARDAGLFLMRVEFELAGFDLDDESFRQEFAPTAREFDMRWRLEFTECRPRVAIFVSRYQHCLLDLLHLHQTGELDCEMPLVLSNYVDAGAVARFHGIPFHCVPMTQSTKAEAEEEQLGLLRENRIDLVILARYMQVLSPGFVAQYPLRIINVHHSFLPAFSGARPYHAAFERGVKLIGATSHYVTDALDEGPIIEQDVARVSHRDQVADLTRKGQDLERAVLSRAVRWHLERRILFYGNRTVVFE